MKPAWLPPPRDPLVREREVHVWYCDFREITGLRGTLAVLSEQERERAARFKTEESRLTFLGSHIFLRQILATYLRVSPALVSFTADGNGKPRLDGATHSDYLQFNLTHCGGSAACAISRSAVGIDMESPDDRLCDDGTAAQVFSPQELFELGKYKSEQRKAAFFRGWTKKEAYAKCVGLGLSLDLTEVELGFVDGQSSFDKYSLTTFYCPNQTVATLAVEGSSSRVTFWEWPAQKLLIP